MTLRDGEHLLERQEPLDARQFELAVKRLADSLSYGSDRSPFVGSGIEYAQSRPYQPGDSVRSIDWRLTARTGKHFVKEYESPKQTPVLLLVDTSASMTVSSVKRTKYELAVQLAGGLALASLDRVSPVGVLGVGGRPLRVAPSLSREQVYQWLHLLRRYRTDEPTTLGRRMAELSASLHEHALVIVLSDLHDPSAVPAISQLAERHDVVVIQLQDPAEVGLRGVGILRAREAETGRLVVGPARGVCVDGEEAARSLKRRGVDHVVLRTDGPFVHLLRHFLDARGSIRRGTK